MYEQRTQKPSAAGEMNITFYEQNPGCMELLDEIYSRQSSRRRNDKFIKAAIHRGFTEQEANDYVLRLMNLS
jgi:hypothetical protein